MARKSNLPGAQAMDILSAADATQVSRLFAVAPSGGVKTETKKRFSVTSDIVAFRRCARQYGFFAHRGFVPARAAQLYFGTVIHQVMDRIHAYFAGMEDGSKGRCPSKEQIAAYVDEVDAALKLQGVRPMSSESKGQVLEYLVRFNDGWGPEIYPRIVDTERRLERDEGRFILLGVVDVLAKSAAATGLDKDRPGELEIWDYKGGRIPRKRGGSIDYDHADLKNYQFQMLVYGRLYRQATGVLPRRAVLWFLGETERSAAEFEVRFTDEAINTAFQVFSDTVESILACSKEDRWSAPTGDQLPDDDTCNACDVRWSCPSRRRSYDLPIY